MVNEYVAIPELLRRQDQRLSTGIEGNFGFFTTRDEMVVVVGEEVTCQVENQDSQANLDLQENLDSQANLESQKRNSRNDDGDCLTLIMRACLEHVDHHAPPSSFSTLPSVSTSLHHARDIQRRTDDLRESKKSLARYYMLFDL